jgi:WD40 repeat protein
MVSARADSGGCVYADGGEVRIAAAGDVVEAALVLRTSAGCPAGGDAGLPPDAGDGRADGPPPDGPGPSEPDAPTVHDGPPPDVAVFPPPSLTISREFLQDSTPPGCDVNAATDEAGVRAGAFSPDGKLFASASESSWTGSWSVSGPALQQTGGNFGKNALHAIAYSPDGTLLAAAGAAGEVDVWRVGAGWLSVFARAGDDPRIDYTWLSFAADSDRILTVSPLANTLQVWSVARKGPAAEIPVGPVAAVAASLQPPSSGPWWAAVASTANKVSFFDLNAPAPTGTAPFQVSGIVRKLALSSDGRMLAVSSDAGLFLWDVTDKNKPLPQVPALRSPVLPNDYRDLAFSPSGRHLAATIPRVGTTALYSVDTRDEVARVTLRGAPLSLAWSADGRALAIGRPCGLITYCRD